MGVKYWQILPNFNGAYERHFSTLPEGRRPSCETCEECHMPQKLSGDPARTRSIHLYDETNTNKTDTVAFKSCHELPGIEPVFPAEYADCIND